MSQGPGATWFDGLPDRQGIRQPVGLRYKVKVKEKVKVKVKEKIKIKINGKIKIKKNIKIKAKEKPNAIK